ncbi:MAG: Sjogren's syndrome/scleroderma autoantigen 1 family protein [Candidatus Bathyarchaeia archaeon]
MSEESKRLQSMTDLLRQGATLTELPCPACSSPLFKLRGGNLWCAQCQKRVIVVKEGESPTRATRSMLLTSLESTLLMKIQEVERRIREEADLEKLQGLGGLLSTLLESLERIRKIKRA